jgi:AraC-like DNA-binding protein
LIEPGDVHVTTRVAAPAHFDTLFIDPRVLCGLAEAAGRTRPLHFRGIDTRAPLHVAAFARLHAALRDPLRASERRELWEQAIHDLLDGETEVGLPGTDPGQQRLARARELIHAKYQVSEAAKPVCVAALANEVGLTAIELIRAFRRQYGVPPYQYLSHLRVARARNLIDRGPTGDIDSLADVAQAAGFFDLSHMDRFFRRLLHLRPSDYAAAADGHRPRWGLVRRGRQ